MKFSINICIIGRAFLLLIIIANCLTLKLCGNDIISINSVKITSDECLDYTPVKCGCNNGNIDAGEQIGIMINLKLRAKVSDLKLDAYTRNSAVFFKNSDISFTRLYTGPPTFVETLS